jgi:hypothetical protein
MDGVGARTDSCGSPDLGDPMTPRYATIAYGDDPGVYRQAVMLIVSLLAYAPEPREIVVATDRPERFVWFGTRIEIEFLTRERLASWRRTPRVSLREKLELARVLKPADRPLVLLDADTLATADLRPFLERLDSGAVFLHTCEYELRRRKRSGDQPLLRALDGATFAGWTMSDERMWNSGVLAVGAGDGGLLDDAVRLYDAMVEAGVRHFALEQFAVGVVLGRTGRLEAAQRWFVHYWGNKKGYDAELARRLADAFLRGDSATEAVEDYRARPIDLPAEMRPTPAQKLSRWLRR